MNTLLRMSESASLALHTMALLAATPDERLSRQQIAERFGVSEHTLAKVMQRLVHQNLVQSTRGPGGGFVLARPAAEVPLLAVFEAVEGPLADASECPLVKECVCHDRCLMGGLEAGVHRLVRETLAGHHLDQLAGSMKLCGHNQEEVR